MVPGSRLSSPTACFRPFQTSRTITVLPVFGLPKQSSDANAYDAGTPSDHRSLQQSFATALLEFRQKQATEIFGREPMMRHVVDLSETIESVTEIVEANCVLTHSSDFPSSRRFGTTTATLVVVLCGAIPSVVAWSVRVQIREGVATMIPEIQGEGPGCPIAPAEETPLVGKLCGLHQCTCGYPMKRGSKGRRGDILAPSKPCRLVVVGKVRRQRNSTSYRQWLL